MVKISFIVPCYNASQYINRCMDSLFRQGFETGEFEVIVINDGSTDDTLEKLNIYRQPNVKIFTQENQGLSGARNSGLQKACGEYIWFVDADDYLLPESAPQVFALAIGEALDILIFAMKEVSDNRISTLWHQEVINDVTLSGSEFILAGYQPNSVCAALYSREYLERHPELRFYPRLYHQDVEFNYRAIASARRVRFISDVHYVYELHPHSISQSMETEKIKKRLTDNGLIASSFNSFASNLSDRQLSKRIHHQATSIVVGTLMQLRQYDDEIRRDVIASFRTLGFFPMYGAFKSFRQCLAAVWLNIRFYHYI